MADIYNIAGRIHSTSQEAIAVVTDEVYDTEQQKTQAEINTIVASLNHEDYVNYSATEGDTLADILPSTGAVNRVYRVANWKGDGNGDTPVTYYNVNCYSEYVWNASTSNYTLLSVSDRGIDATPTSGSNNLVKSGGVYSDITIKDNSIQAETNGLVITKSIVSGVNNSIEIPVSIKEGESFQIKLNDPDNIITDGYTGVRLLYTDDTWSDYQYINGNTLYYKTAIKDIKHISVGIFLAGITSSGEVSFFTKIAGEIDNELFSLKSEEGRWDNSVEYVSGQNNVIEANVAITKGTVYKFKFASKVVVNGYSILYAIYKNTNSPTQLQYINNGVTYSLTAADDIKALKVVTFSTGVTDSGTASIKILIPGTNGDFLDHLSENVNTLNAVTKERYTFSNGIGCKNEINSHIEQIDSTGASTENYGTQGNVTVVNLGNVKDKRFYVSFKFKINENINVPTPASMDITKYDADLLNIFEYVGQYKKRVGIIPKEFTQSIISSNKYASLYGQAQYACCWNVRTKQDYYAFDGWGAKLMTGKRVLSVRYVGSDYENYADDLYISNDGTTLFIHSVSNETPISKSWTLANYSTNSELIAALKNDSDIEVQVFNSYQSTPTQLATFGDICIVNTRSSVINNDDFYIPTAINEDWHIFECMYDPDSNYTRPIIQIDGVGFYERDLSKSDIFNTNDFKVYIGGSESGSNIDISYKDIDVRIVDTLDAELLVNTNSGYNICSNLSPRVMVYTMHDIQNSTVASGTYSTNIDKLYWFFNLAKSKGYTFVTINDICEFVKGNKTLPKRSIVTINDDWREYIFLDRNIRAAFSDFGAKLTLALHTLPGEYSWDEATKTFNYQGTGSSVRELVQNIRACGFDVIFHAKNDDAGGLSANTITEWELWKNSFNQAESLMIDDTIHVYVGGYTTPFHCEHIKTEGVKIALTTTKGLVTRANYEMRIPRYYIDQVESTSQIISELI